MQQQPYRILVVNPGATFTKIAVFVDENCIFDKTIEYRADELAEFGRLINQLRFRTKSILEQLDYEGINLSKLDAVCGRGGLLRPIEGGTYTVNEAMLNDLQLGFNGEHPSNLGGVIANEVAAGLNIPAYIVDPVVVDEMADIAKFSGIPEIPRKSIFHSLNQKAAARRCAKDLGKEYEQVNLIVVHIGDGFTIGAHQYGKVIDVNNGLDGEGPFSLNRAGTVPAGDLVTLCFSTQLNRDEIMQKLVGNGGALAYLQTDDLDMINQQLSVGNPAVIKVYDAMGYQVAKEIGAMAAVLAGNVDAIIFTGELAKQQAFVDKIANRVKWIADTFIYPGQNELQALAEGTLRVLRNVEQAKTYSNN